MSGRKIYVDAYSELYRTALMENGVLTELIMQDRNESVLADNIYVGRVEKVLPSGIAFVDIGEKKPVFLQTNDSRESAEIQRVRPGKEIMVQVIKEAYDEKCAVVTGTLSIAGKYAVIIMGQEQTGVSSKITDSASRQRLREIGNKYCVGDIAPIIRTSAENADEGDIENELKKLYDKLCQVIEKGKYTKAPALIYSESSPLDRAVKDMADEDCAIVVNEKEAYGKLKAKYKNVTLYEGNIPLFRNYSIEGQIEELFNRKIWLKNGGYIIIDETEAMTVIDVNSGKASESGNSAKINMAACEEIARQLRLRNINGMIIIDFINSNDKKENERLLEHMQQCFARDRVRVYIVGMTELGLMQITRQKKRKPLSRYIFRECPVCAGTGYVKNISYVCDSIKNLITDIFASTIYTKVTVSSNENIIAHLKKNCCFAEELSDKRVEYRIIKTAKWDHYEIEKGMLYKNEPADTDEQYHMPSVT